jgi:hypothetical protein
MLSRAEPSLSLEHDRGTIGVARRKRNQTTPGFRPWATIFAQSKLVCAVLLDAPPLAQVLLFHHDGFSAHRTFPGIEAEEWVDLQLQKSFAGQAPQVVSAFSAMHFTSPVNSVQRTCRQPG